MRLPSFIHPEIESPITQHIVVSFPNTDDPLFWEKARKEMCRPAITTPGVKDHISFFQDVSGQLDKWIKRPGRFIKRLKCRIWINGFPDSLLTDKIQVGRFTIIQVGNSKIARAFVIPLRIVKNIIDYRNCRTTMLALRISMIHILRICTLIYKLRTT